MKKCEAEELFYSIHDLLKKLSDKIVLTTSEKIQLIKLLDKYWSIPCPETNPCNAMTCLYAKPIDWIEFHRYTCLNDLLNCFDYESGAELTLKDKGYMDVFDGWRRNGNYNP